MKSLMAVVALMSVSVSVFSQSSFSSASRHTTTVSPLINQASDVAFEIPKPPGLRMRNTGRTLTIIGGAMLVGGIIVYSSADASYYTYSTGSNGTKEEGDPKAALGVLMIAGGAGMTIPGIILWSKGSKKYKRYLEREGDQTVSMDFGRNGLAVSYRF